jgi:phosphohistidine swiveling domain-containing protein
LNKLRKQQNILMAKLKFNSRSKFLIKLAQNVLWQKGYRKDVEYHGFYCYEPIMREIAKRKNVEDWRDLLYMFPWEMEGYILKNKFNNKELTERRKFSCLIVSKNSVKLITGQKARKFYKKLGVEKIDQNLKQTKGQCAFLGKARGPVKLIFVPSDMKKMKKGDVLVSQATSPDIIPAMKLASAIVTNTGGLICHAAITARELRIPCIVGTTNAAEIFKDGDIVEVDAEKGIVKKISKN